MGELISLAERRAARAEAHAPPARPRVSFFFDLASPWTYLAAERVDRLFAEVHWRPAVGDALPADRGGAAERRAGGRACRAAAHPARLPRGMADGGTERDARRHPGRRARARGAVRARGEPP